MVKTFPGEQWKEVVFDFEYTNDTRIEISNFGRLRTFNKLSNGNILKGSMINGYRIVRLKFFKPREEKKEKEFHFLLQQVLKLSKQLKELKQKGKTKKEIAEVSGLLQSLKKNVSKKYAEDLKRRTIHYHSLIHRLVAEYFVPRPSQAHSVVAHLDFDKLNNRASNLKWMTPDENYDHQRNSPYVIAEKKLRVNRRNLNSKATKLTVTKVMLLKKLLNQGKPMRQLVKQFKVTDTQILRIKRGENWADIQPAP